MSFILPVVFGHRGARSIKMENTIEGFRYACQSGIKWVELDVMLSKDKELFVFHDEELDRLSETKGRLDSFAAAELKQVKLSDGQGIPTLADVLDVLNEYDGCVNIEIKPSKDEFARETARKAWEVAKSKGFDHSDRLLFSSFAWDALYETKEIAPHINRGVLVEDVSGDWRPVAKELEAFSINYDANLLTPALIKEIHDGGYKLLVWTVNDIERAKKLISEGVNAVFSDIPVEMSEALGVKL